MSEWTFIASNEAKLLKSRIKKMQYLIQSIGGSVGAGSLPKIKKCDCGVSALRFNDVSPYSHATWCDMFKQGEMDEKRCSN